MTKEYFPVIMINKVTNGIEAVLGLDVKSLLKANLFYDDQASGTSNDYSAVRINEQRMTASRESFIRSIAAWKRNVALEFRLMSLPNLRFRAQGRILMTIVLRVTAKDAFQARKDAVAKYLTLRALLQAHLNEAEYAPITEQGELNFRLAPFHPTHAVAISRRSENIQISEPVEKKTIVGLAGNTSKKNELTGSYVQYSYPWKPSYDDYSRLVSVMMSQLDPLMMIVRLRPGKLTVSRKKIITEDIRKCELYLSAGKSYQISLTHLAGLLRNSLVEKITNLSAESFKVGVFLLAGHEIDASLGAVVGQSIAARSSVRDQDASLFGGYVIRPLSVDRAADSRYYPEKEYFSAMEAACAFRLPSPPIREIPGLPIRRSRTLLTVLPAVVKDDEDGVDLCLNTHNGMSQPVRLPADDRMRHTCICGQTGTGKSTLMESMILQDIRAGHGLAVIDPHGEMIDNIQGKIPESRMKDVIIFDVLDRERPLGFNILQWQTLEERDFIIDELYNTLDEMYSMKATGGPMFESYMRGMLRLLMGNKHHDDYTPTLLEFNNSYVYKKFRHWLADRTDEKAAIDFLKEVEKAGGEAHLDNMSPYVTSKFNRFINDLTLRNILGQEESSLNFEEIMNQGKILLVKLGKGRFGSMVSALLSNQLVAHFKHAAMRRGEIRPEERRDFYLYVDECQNLPASNFTELLSEARKYRMGLILATQYASQLKNENHKEDLLSAIFGNCGCITTFRLGQEDANLLAQSLYPYFSAADIIGLPNWQGYCKLQIGNQSVTPFSFESVMDQTPYDPKVAKKVSDLSRQKYGRDVETIKKQIEKRQYIWVKEDEE